MPHEVRIVLTLMQNYTIKNRLSYFRLPYIESIEDLSSLTHLSKGLLFRLIKYPEKNYFSYEIPKNTGGNRDIHQPSFELKAVQGWILRNILEKLNSSQAATGFEKGKSIKNNVSPHVGAKAILCLDIDNFFPSINGSRVWNVFFIAGYSAKASSLLTNLCTFNGFLPQGAPTSPKLANLVCWRLDRRLMGYLGKRRIIYTRYSDDLTFSSSSLTSLSKAYYLIKHIIEDEGFSINKNKTRFRGPARAKIITGLVLNSSGFGIGRKNYRKLRSMIHNLAISNNVDDVTITYLNGYLSYLADVDSTNYKRLTTYIGDLASKYPNIPRSLHLLGTR